jgi:RHS repeat-associated protein
MTQGARSLTRRFCSGMRLRGGALVVVMLVTMIAGTGLAEAAEPLPPACAINATPEACIAAALTAGFPEPEIAVDEFGDFFWGSSGSQAYSTGTDDESDVYENGAAVEEGHIFRANSGVGGSLAIFVGVHNSTLVSIEVPSDQALSCDYENKACYGDATHYYGNPGPPEAPANTVAPAISGATQVGQTLSASAGTWSGIPSPSYSYQWESCNGLGEGCMNISGATASSYTLTEAELGDTIVVQVAASNSAGSASASSAASAVVAVPVCTDSWTGEAGDGNWRTAGNWSSEAVPDAIDRACIPASASVTISGGAAQAGSVLDEGSLSIAGYSLTLSSGATTSEINSLSIGNATLTSSSRVEVSGSLSTGAGATVAGGRLVLQTGATGAITGCQPLTLDGTTLENDGTLTTGAGGGAEDGEIRMESGAQLDNAGTFNEDSYDNGSCWDGRVIDDNGGAESTVANSGTFNVESGGGRVAEVNLPFENEGTINVRSGTFMPSRSGTSTGGTWITEGAASVDISHYTYVFSATDASAAAFTIGGGSLEASGTSKVGSLAIASSTVNVAGTLQVDTAFTASSNAQLAGSGTLVLESEASGSLTGCAPLLLNGATLENEGTLTAGAAGGSEGGEIAMSESSELENSGTFNEDTYDNNSCWNTHAIEGGTGPHVLNTGTFNVEAGSGKTSEVNARFENEGAVRVHSGTLALPRGGASTDGTWTSTSGAAVAFTGGAYSLTGDDASEAAFALGGTLEVAGTVKVASLSLSGGAAHVSGQLQVEDSFAAGESTTVTGPGSLVIEPTATGEINGCSSLLLNGGVTLQNDGVITAGSAGGSEEGEIHMAAGAQLENAGTFDEDTYDNSSCFDSHAIEDEGGAGSITNTGAFDLDSGSEQISAISVPFDNEGSVRAHSGTLRLTGGGSAGVAAYGTWSTDGGAIVLAGGTFEIAAETDLSEVSVDGASLVWAARSLRGWLDALAPYVSGTVPLAGSGEGGLDGALASATIEVLAPGETTWQTLCGSLSPEVAGTFECSWETAGGSYPDGEYELRVELQNSASPTETVTTVPVSVLVDNTAPTGSLEAPPEHSLGGPVEVTGAAADSGSGVDSWSLQIAEEGSSAWTSACPTQYTPLSEAEYGCTINTSAAYLANGAYQLREIVRDRAGNEHVSSPVDLQVDNTHLAATLDSPAADVSGTIELEGLGSSTSEDLESWTAQITPADQSSWTDACPTQTTPAIGSTYRCALDTTSLPDGPYDLRAVAADTAGDTYTTEPTATVLDNTPPLGHLYALPSSFSGSVDVEGYAADAASGVSSWVLEVAPAGSESFSEACLAQTEPIFGFVYGCSFDASALEDGEYKLRATITDEAGNTYTTATLETTVENAAPSNTAAPSISGHAIAGSTLKAAAGTWSGVAPIAFAYQWQRCNSSGESCSNIEGATGSSYEPTSEDAGSTARVVVTATNGAGEATVASPASATIAADTLADLTAPQVSGTPQAGATLSAGAGEWSGEAPIAFAYAWERCNSAGGECAEIEEAVGKRYTLTVADVSSTIRAVVTATNAEGSSSATSAPSPVVAPSSGSGIRYVYDRAGRLSIVDDPEKGAALYHWDADGNLTSIQRFAHEQLAVLAVTPGEAAIGQAVDIVGTGFSAEGSQDEVSFDGTAGTVTEASATDLTVVVPEGADAGKITVTVAGESAESPEDFTPSSGSEEMAARLFSRSASLSSAGAGKLAKVAAARTTTNVRARLSSSRGPAGPQAKRASSQATNALRAARRFRPTGPAVWRPGRANRRDGDWRTAGKPTPWAKLPALAARRGRTGLSGQALLDNGEPLANVTLSVQGSAAVARTDETGRFLLSGLPAGHQVLVIDGSSADRRGLRYGRFSAGVDVIKGKTTALEYTIWMTALDPAGNRRIQSPLRAETTVTNPRIPGLEVRLPAGTVVRSAAGKVVHELNLTAIPVDRPPFPLPLFATSVPTFFTVQPGGAYLNKGAQIIYPNWGHLPAGQRVDFWNYDPTDKGWYIYGKGSVSADGSQVIPDPNVRVWELTGAMITGEHEPAEHEPCPTCRTEGDPVDPISGIFVYDHTDLKLPASPMPLSFTRTYRPRDSNSYSFGIGTQDPYDIHLWSDENYKSAYLVLPDGGKVHLVRTSPGTGYVEAVYTAEGTPTEWAGATLHWDSTHSDWVLRRRDGTKFIFGELAPLQAIEDRNGNRITLEREGGPNGPIVKVLAPHGRWLMLDHDGDGRVVQVADNAGQVVKYEYNASGRLAKVIDPLGHATRYAYDSSGDMTSVTDARGIKLIANSYDARGQVATQTIGGRGTYHFLQYPGQIVGPDGTSIVPGRVLGPNGYTRTIWPDWSTGLPAQEELNGRQVNYGYDSSGRITKVISGSREASFTYDADGDLTSVKQEAAGHSPLVTTYAYNEFAEPTTVTDPMGRVATYGYDSDGNLVSETDPLGRQSTFGYDSEGELTSTADAEGAVTEIGYARGEPTSIVNPLGDETQLAYDGIGRPTKVRDAEGGDTTLSYDADNELTSETNPAGEKVSYGYDATGNLISVTDPRGHTQTGTYNSFEQLASWTDALERTTSYSYDSEGSLEAVTDPLGQTTRYSYDAFGQPSTVSFGSVEGGAPSSSISYGYDEQGDLTSVDDSRAGTWTLHYDPFSRLSGEEGPSGSVEYASDADGETTSSTLDGEETTSYSYNEDGQPTAIASPAGEVAFSYDHDGRPSRTTLPDGDSESYSYDDASQLTEIDDQLPGGAQLGSLQYTRDPLGRVAKLSGSLARTNLPEALSGLSYDDANELTSLGGQALGYDADGNLTEDGSTTYKWNDRGELSEVKAGESSSSFSYDPFGRRAGKDVGGASTSYLYDGENVARETSGGETSKLLNGLGLDERFARTTGSNTDSYLTDELGSTIALANEAGEPATEYSYDPFGAATSTGASSSNPYQYAGGASEGALQQDGARSYDPALGRFISADPAGMAGSGVNLYQYAGSDPIDYADPSGLSIFGELLEGAGEFVTGFGDTVSGGLTRDAREGLGLAEPNYSSGAYGAGSDSGIAAAFAIPGDEEVGALGVGEEAADGGLGPVLGEEHGPEASGFRPADPGNPSSNSTFNEPPRQPDERPEGSTYHYDPKDRGHGLGEHIDVHRRGVPKERWPAQGPFGSIFLGLPG